MEQEERPLFKETQQFRQIWLWIILLGVSAWLSYKYYQQIILGRSVGDQSTSDVLLVSLWLLIGIGLPIAFYKAKLVTKVYWNRISIRFYPIHRSEHEYPFSQIDRVEAVKYWPILQYGGWGIRFGWDGKAYNVSGRHGVKLHFSSVRPLLIGSQHSEELAETISKAMDTEHR